MTEPVQWHRHQHRPELIDLVLDFVRNVRGMAGVREIALIGSLCTPKPYPKDADLLVTMDDRADLAPLARYSRRLQGQATALGHGSDVFLLNQEGHYIGRVCPWKECRPGIRVRCDALHCGRREFLHDDQDTVKLSPAVIASPPLRLWPIIEQHRALPADLIARLVQPLRSEPDGHVHSPGDQADSKGPA